jgi:hypothetical protein
MRADPLARNRSRIADADGGNEKPAGRRVFGSSIEPRRIGAIT